MRRSWTWWLAWSLWALSVAQLLAVLMLGVLARGKHEPADGDGPAGFLFVFPILAFPTVGALVASRRPRHPVGWLFLAAGVLFGLSALAPEYARYSIYVSERPLPGTNAFVWSSTWIDPIVFLAIALVMLFFPTGTLPSRRWRPVLWLVVATAVVAFASSAVKPGPVFEDSLPVDNPLGVESLQGFLDSAGAVVWLLFAATIVLAGASVIFRFRHAEGVERVQLKWIAQAALFLVLGFVAANTTGVLGPVGDAVVTGVFALALASVPIAVGVAILRYRLYEIDRIISRTLVYASLTIVLGAAYAGLVLAGQAVFSSIAGGSNLAIAVSTLVVAALFLPVRSRVQRVVDRRFNRRRYDAQRTLEIFGTRLREQLDLDELGAELRAVVSETMQPLHVSVWQREGGS